MFSAISSYLSGQKKKTKQSKKRVLFKKNIKVKRAVSMSEEDVITNIKSKKLRAFTALKETVSRYLSENGQKMGTINTDSQEDLGIMDFDGRKMAYAEYIDEDVLQKIGYSAKYVIILREKDPNRGTDGYFVIEKEGDPRNSTKDNPQGDLGILEWPPEHGKFRIKPETFILDRETTREWCIYKGYLVAGFGGEQEQAEKEEEEKEGEEDADQQPKPKTKKVFTPSTSNFLA